MLVTRSTVTVTACGARSARAGATHDVTFCGMTNRKTSIVKLASAVCVAVSLLSSCGLVKNETSSKEAQTSAEMFDRELRSIASFGNPDSNNPNDVDPRRPSYLLEMASKGDVVDASTPAAALASTQLRVLVWQGSGAAISWTRLVCASDICREMESTWPCNDYESAVPVDTPTCSESDNLKARTRSYVSATPATGKLVGTDSPAAMCLQFRKSGQDVWMSISEVPNQQSLISSDMETACSSSVFAGITPATGTTYADLGTATAATDATW